MYSRSPLKGVCRNKPGSVAAVESDRIAVPVKEEDVDDEEGEPPVEQQSHVRNQEGGTPSRGKESTSPQQKQGRPAQSHDARGSPPPTPPIASPKHCSSPMYSRSPLKGVCRNKPGSVAAVESDRIAVPVKEEDVDDEDHPCHHPQATTPRRSATHHPASLVDGCAAAAAPDSDRGRQPPPPPRPNQLPSRPQANRPPPAELPGRHSAVGAAAASLLRVSTHLRQTRPGLS
eukprot:COSAG03_NODE_95_length_13149_cov_7.907969_1_plen_231_part_00